jgi:hypothetical protein
MQPQNKRKRHVLVHNAQPVYWSQRAALDLERERDHFAAAYRSRYRWFEDRRAPEYERAAV